VFRKEYLHAIGGYRTTSVVEDLDLVVRLHRYCSSTSSITKFLHSDPVAWTEVPESARIPVTQRERGTAA